METWKQLMTIDDDDDDKYKQLTFYGSYSVPVAFG
jgi:hypothetical protein